jgi:MFS family permease
VRGRLGALGEREFRLLWLSRVVSDFGDRFGTIGLAFAVLGIKASASALAYVLAARTISSIALFLVAGVWADRLPRQLVMLGSDVVRGLAHGTLAVLLLTGRAEIWQLVVLAAVYGAGEAFFGPSSQGLVPQTVSASRLQEANALMSLSRNVTAVAGPAVAGVVIALSSAGWAIAVDAATFAVSAAFLLRMRLAFTKPAAQSFLTDLREGWSEFMRRTWVWVCVCHFALFQFAALAPFFVLGPYISKTELGGASAYATITAFAGVGSIIGSLVALRFRPSRQLVSAFLAIVVWTPVFDRLRAGRTGCGHLSRGIGGRSGDELRRDDLVHRAPATHPSTRALACELVRLGRLGALPPARLHPRRAAGRSLRRRRSALCGSALDDRLESRDPGDPERAEPPQRDGRTSDG